MSSPDQEVVVHFGDCNIYKADNPHCSCGLIHDLTMLAEYPEEIYNKYWDDYLMSEYCDRDYPRQTEEEKEECQRLLEELLGHNPFDSPTESEQRGIDEDISIIHEIFPGSKGSPDS